ncbi:hypothetical protein GGR54DRAFT_108108 [Hypoxylon sp. NC1633]|nr:hypothetical protein GGR54DRAFT_108108 [Hypoxylon sp. NC1633]
MPSRHHNHLHRRQNNAWDEFVSGAESVANDLDPFKDTPTVQVKQAQSTFYKTVYKTMSATFDGPIAGYSTVGQTDDTPQTEAAAAVTTPTTSPSPTAQAEPTNSPSKAPENTTPASAAEVENTSPVSTAKETQTETKTSDVLPSSIVPTTSVDLSEHSTLAVATSSPTPTTQAEATKNLENSGAVSATSAAASTSASSTAVANSSSSDTSSAAKAGIAIGVLGGILVVALLMFFLFNKRRRQLAQQQAQDDEKINGPLGGRPVSVLSTQTSATAPQLSLRPVTQFMPSFGERRSSKGAALALATGSTSANSANANRSAWERPGTSHANNPENPFGNNAERAYTPTGEVPPTNPFDNPVNVVGVAQTTNSPPKSSPIAGAVASVAAGAAVTRQLSTRKDAPPPLDLTIPAGPPSPAVTEFSVHSVAPGQSPGPSRSAAAIAAAGGPPSSAVHRVQLDFTPTLDDEMGLRAGQLVRLLHEYDDGWSLCIRLDRSKQGVVPRTCLSTRPVKPRPAGGPPGTRNGPPVNPSGPRGPRGPGGPGPNYPPGQRPMTPQSGRPESPMRPMTAGRPQSPAGMRPQSPATGRPMSPYGSRPASPANGRPMSPGPRAQSPGPRQQRRMSPPGPSPMNPNGGAPAQQQYRGPPQGSVGRKPVPGQAY